MIKCAKRFQKTLYNPYTTTDEKLVCCWTNFWLGKVSKMQCNHSFNNVELPFEIDLPLKSNGHPKLPFFPGKKKCSHTVLYPFLCFRYLMNLILNILTTLVSYVLIITLNQPVIVWCRHYLYRNSRRKFLKKFWLASTSYYSSLYLHT